MVVKGGLRLGGGWAQKYLIHGFVITAGFDFGGCLGGEIVCFVQGREEGQVVSKVAEILFS